MDLDAVALFNDLDAAALGDVERRLQQRRVGANETICRQGEPGHGLFIITKGVAHVFLEQPEGRHRVGVLRRGDVVGEMSLLTDEPRSATVVAVVPSEVAVLDREGFAAVLAAHPELLTNLTRILSRRLAHATAAPTRGAQRGEALALVAGTSAVASLPVVLEAARQATTLPVATTGWAADAEIAEVPRRLDVTLVALDDLLHDHDTVVVAVTPVPDFHLLLPHVDRVVILCRPEEAPGLLERSSGATTEPELILLADGEDDAPPAGGTGLPATRVIDLDDPGALRWLARHLTRTRLGLALGAGGAKGFAHVGALEVLSSAGCTFDYISGSSIGALVGASIAQGHSPTETEELLRRTFTPDAVKELLTLSLAGTSAGLEVLTRICHEIAGDLTFEDLDIPLIVQCVDLDAGEPVAITEGPLADALVAAAALAGLFPPVVRHGRRLIDALALTPVPLDAVQQAGADVTVAVNLMSRETLPAWPGEPVADPEPPGRYRILETLLEVMELAHVDASIRDAERADVTVTPRFGPCTWRDFHLADPFLEAGRLAAKEALPQLEQRVRL